MAGYGYSQEYEKVCPKGDGGTSTVTNQDERMILEATTQGCTVRAEGMQEPGRH
jgi:hypothetical protein